MITPDAKKMMDDWNATRSPNLKPCPFCGGGVLTVESKCLVNGHRYWGLIHKPEKKCPLVDLFGNWKSSEKYTTEGKAIEAWNRRADDVDGSV